VVARIHEDKCIGCQLCYTACWDGAHQCIHLDRADATEDVDTTPQQIAASASKRITMTPIPKLDLDGLGSLGGERIPLARIPRVDEHHCVGCNLCSLVCPVPECITMEQVPNDLPMETWEQKVAAGYAPAGVTAPKDLF
jgi:dihydropyrimidine dehydrogenase (NAD+) subunit PreA